jgi:hypothetical protein
MRLQSSSEVSSKVNTTGIDQRVEPAEARAHRRHGVRYRPASETSQCSSSVLSGSARPATAPQQLALDVEQRHLPALGEPLAVAV